MITLHKTLTLESFVVTLSEKRTLVNPTYHFLCTNVTTKETIVFEVKAIDDLSGYPNRYNEFQIATATVFAGATAGQWNYVATELISNIEMENGKLILNDTAKIIFTGYEPTTTYQGYGG